MVLFCIYSFLSPTLKAPLIRRIEKGDLMRSAPHNFLRGRAVLNLNQMPSAEYSKNPSWNYLEIAWRFIHIKKARGLERKAGKGQRHHTSYKCNRCGLIMMPAGLFGGFNQSFSNHVFTPTRVRCFLLRHHQSITERNRRPSYLIILMQHGYS